MKDNKQVLCWYYIQKRQFTIHPEYFDARSIFSHQFIKNIKHEPNMFKDLSRQMKISLKNIDCRTVSKSKYNKYYASLARMVRHNAVEGHMPKTKLY